MAARQEVARLVAICQGKTVRNGVVVERRDRHGDQVQSDGLEEHVLPWPPAGLQ